MSLSIGQTVNGYALLDYFDSSSKRISFRALNTANHRIEQLNILPDSVRNDPERSARFIRESRILATLQHPNIVTCHGVVELGGHLAISVEALEAVSLADRLELGPFEIEEAVQAILQLLAAAGAAHAAGVVHREISPSNILVTPEKTIKLSGFTVAKSMSDPSVTRAGTIVGSATFTAPEVFRGVAALDPRIDVYAIGCVFYALVTGRPPFNYKGEYDVMMAHLNEVPAPPSTHNPSINALLDAVILKALEKDPDKRYQSASEFYHAILNPGDVYVPPAPVAAAPEPPSPEFQSPLPAPAPVPTPNVTPGLTLAVVAIGAGLTFLLVAVWILMHSRPTPQ